MDELLNCLKNNILRISYSRVIVETAAEDAEEYACVLNKDTSFSRESLDSFLTPILFSLKKDWMVKEIIPNGDFIFRGFVVSENRFLVAFYQGIFYGMAPLKDGGVRLTVSYDSNKVFSGVVFSDEACNLIDSFVGQVLSGDLPRKDCADALPLPSKREFPF